MATEDVQNISMHYLVTRGRRSFDLYIYVNRSMMLQEQLYVQYQKMQRKKFKEEEEQEDTATFIILMKRMCRIFVLKNS